MTQETLRSGADYPVRLHALPQTIVFITTTLLVCLSVVLFMIDSTSNQVGTMLNTQNAASFKLWQNLKYLEQHPSLDDSLPPDLMADVVEFSRTTANIIKTAHRLKCRHIFFAPSASWDRVKEHIKPVDGDQREFAPNGRSGS